MQRPFQVRVSLFKEVEFLIDANTPEEAESIAEQYIADGEGGIEVACNIDEIEALPVDEIDGDLFEEGR